MGLYSVRRDITKVHPFVLVFRSNQESMRAAVSRMWTSYMFFALLPIGAQEALIGEMVWAAVSVNREGSLAVAVHGSEQFHNLRALSGIAQGGIYFHPSD